LYFDLIWHWLYALIQNSLTWIQMSNDHYHPFLILFLILFFEDVDWSAVQVPYQSDHLYSITNWFRLSQDNYLKFPTHLFLYEHFLFKYYHFPHLLPLDFIKVVYSNSSAITTLFPLSLEVPLFESYIQIAPIQGLCFSKYKCWS